MFNFDPYSREVDIDPYPLYKTLRDEYPCYWSHLGDCWVLSRFDDISENLKKWEVFSSAKGNMLDDLPERAGSTLGTTDPPRHDNPGVYDIDRRAKDHLGMGGGKHFCLAHHLPRLCQRR